MRNHLTCIQVVSSTYRSDNPVPYLLFELAGDEVDGDRELLLLVERLAEELGHQPHNPIIHQNFIEPASPHYYLRAVLRIRRIRMLFLGLLDPDPLVRRYGSGSGSGSFYHTAKIVRKTLIPTVWRLLYDFLTLKNDVNVLSKSSKQKNF
jgi:hypothetical protein